MTEKYKRKNQRGYIKTLRYKGKKYTVSGMTLTELKYNEIEKWQEIKAENGGKGMGRSAKKIVDTVEFDATYIDKSIAAYRGRNRITKTDLFEQCYFTLDSYNHSKRSGRIKILYLKELCRFIGAKYERAITIPVKEKKKEEEEKKPEAKEESISEKQEISKGVVTLKFNPPDESARHWYTELVERMEEAGKGDQSKWRTVAGELEAIKRQNDIMIKQFGEFLKYESEINNAMNCMIRIWSK